MYWSSVLSPRGGNSKSGALVVQVIDHKVQEDARRLVWTKNSDDIAQFFYQSLEAVDMSKLEEGHGSLVFDIRVMEPPSGAVYLRMDCGWPCTGSLEVSGLLDNLALGEWLRVAVPLSCFKAAGANMLAIDTPFLLATKGPMIVDVGEVILTSDTAGTVWWPCDTQVPNT
jgi:beta-glucosidase